MLITERQRPPQRQRLISRPSVSRSPQSSPAAVRAAVINLHVHATIHSLCCGDAMGTGGKQRWRRQHRPTPPPPLIRPNGPRSPSSSNTSSSTSTRAKRRNSWCECGCGRVLALLLLVLRLVMLLERLHCFLLCCTRKPAFPQRRCCVAQRTANTRPSPPAASSTSGVAASPAALPICRQQHGSRTHSNGEARLSAHLLYMHKAIAGNKRMSRDDNGGEGRRRREERRGEEGGRREERRNERGQNMREERREKRGKDERATERGQNLIEG